MTTAPPVFLFDHDEMTTLFPNSSVNMTMVRGSPSALKIASDIVIKTTLIIIMAGMGSTIEIKPLLQHLRRPVGIAIGMLSQFIVLPAVTFGLAHALQMSTFPALGMLVMASCPGGSTSNVFSYWMDGDVPLSVAMTATSTIVATGMMPLNLFIYSRSWTDETLVIPYVNIAISFVMTITPAAVGMFFRWKWPKLADMVVKCGSVAGAIAVVLTLTLMSVMYPFMYRASWSIYLGAFLLPTVGFLFGYLVATLFRMDTSRRITVSLETGIQNFPLCMTLLTLTFDKSMFALISLFPLMYGVTCILCSILFLFLYKICVFIVKWNDKRGFYTVAKSETEVKEQKA
ncbi:ileal sodium/bile acid cotransporter-like [Ylistrum balloti]|uniref:ileal sodium/bile acid cotransporter-like n=1 Tax=Ylistrum balloti TaxID=509963 RepID=UPI002905C896|nr:ileal sodium/bile acid cotransporter-like [Ylistrum balloti]